jgi:hypothetical protein
VIKLKKLECLGLILFVFLLSGCAKDFQGTWCLYTETPSSLVILKSDISDNELTKIKDYLNSLSNLKSFDVINNIEEAYQMINVYYTSKDNISDIESKLQSLSGIASVTDKTLNTPKEELVITNDNYTYGINLDNISASESTGKYTIKNNTLTLDNNNKFYYKDKYLCNDQTCTVIYTKANGSTCNS